MLILLTFDWKRIFSRTAQCPNPNGTQMTPDRFWCIKCIKYDLNDDIRLSSAQKKSAKMIS